MPEGKYDRKLAATSCVSDPEATVDISLKISTQCSASERWTIY